MSANSPSAPPPLSLIDLKKKNRFVFNLERFTFLLYFVISVLTSKKMSTGELANPYTVDQDETYK